MRSKLLRLVMCLFVVASFASVALAQGGNAAKPAKPPTLTTAELIAQAEGVVESGAELSITVTALLREATDDNDVQKVACLNDKLAQINGNLGSAQQHLKALRRAKDRGTRGHKHTMIMVIDQKLQVLGQEAGQCVGKELYETGETTVDTLLDEDSVPFEGDPSVPPMVLPPSMPTVQPPESGMR